MPQGSDSHGRQRQQPAAGDDGGGCMQRGPSASTDDDHMQLHGAADACAGQCGVRGRECDMRRRCAEWRIVGTRSREHAARTRPCIPPPPPPAPSCSLAHRCLPWLYALEHARCDCFLRCGVVAFRCPLALLSGSLPASASSWLVRIWSGFLLLSSLFAVLILGFCFLWSLLFLLSCRY